MEQDSRKYYNELLSNIDIKNNELNKKKNIIKYTLMNVYDNIDVLFKIPISLTPSSEIENNNCHDKKYNKKSFRKSLDFNSNENNYKSKNDDCLVKEKFNSNESISKYSHYFYVDLNLTNIFLTLYYDYFLQVTEKIYGKSNFIIFHKTYYSFLNYLYSNLDLKDKENYEEKSEQKYFDSDNFIIKENSLVVFNFSNSFTNSKISKFLIDDVKNKRENINDTNDTYDKGVKLSHDLKLLDKIKKIAPFLSNLIDIITSSFNLVESKKLETNIFNTDGIEETQIQIKSITLIEADITLLSKYNLELDLDKIGKNDLVFIFFPLYDNLEMKSLLENDIEKYEISNYIMAKIESLNNIVDIFNKTETFSNYSNIDYEEQYRITNTNERIRNVSNFVFESDNLLIENDLTNKNKNKTRKMSTLECKFEKDTKIYYNIVYSERLSKDYFKMINSNLIQNTQLLKYFVSLQNYYKNAYTEKIINIISNNLLITYDSIIDKNVEEIKFYIVNIFENGKISYDKVLKFLYFLKPYFYQRNKKKLIEELEILNKKVDEIKNIHEEKIKEIEFNFVEKMALEISKVEQYVKSLSYYNNSKIDELINMFVHIFELLYDKFTEFEYNLKSANENFKKLFIENVLKNIFENERELLWFSSFLSHIPKSTQIIPHDNLNIIVKESNNNLIQNISESELNTEISSSKLNKENLMEKLDIKSNKFFYIHGMISLAVQGGVVRVLISDLVAGLLGGPIGIGVGVLSGIVNVVQAVISNNNNSKDSFTESYKKCLNCLKLFQEEILKKMNEILKTSIDCKKERIETILFILKK